MTDEKKVEKVEDKKEKTLEERLTNVSEQLKLIKGQIKQTEDQMVKNQRQLQARKDSLLSMGLELQGQEKLLKDILGIKDVPEEVKLAEAKETPKKEEAAPAK